jgi:hypothetical protein
MPMQNGYDIAEMRKREHTVKVSRRINIAPEGPVVALTISRAYRHPINARRGVRGNLRP